MLSNIEFSDRAIEQWYIGINKPAEDAEYHDSSYSTLNRTYGERLYDEDTVERLADFEELWMRFLLARITYRKLDNIVRMGSHEDAKSWVRPDAFLDKQPKNGYKLLQRSLPRHSMEELTELNFLCQTLGYELGFTYLELLELEQAFIARLGYILSLAPEALLFETAAPRDEDAALFHVRGLRGLKLNLPTEEMQAEVELVGLGGFDVGTQEQPAFFIERGLKLYSQVSEHIWREDVRNPKDGGAPFSRNYFLLTPTRYWTLYNAVMAEHAERAVARSREHLACMMQ